MFDCRDSPGLYLSILHIETTGATRRPEPNNSVSGRVPDESLPVFRWSSEVQHDTVTMKRIIQIWELKYVQYASVCLFVRVLLLIVENSEKYCLATDQGHLFPPVLWIGAFSIINDELIEHIEHIEHIWIHLQQHCVVQILWCSDWLGLARNFHGEGIWCIWKCRLF